MAMMFLLAGNLLVLGIEADVYGVEEWSWERGGVLYAIQERRDAVP
jgi:hypothetical protein